MRFKTGRNTKGYVKRHFSKTEWKSPTGMSESNLADPVRKDKTWVVVDVESSYPLSWPEFNTTVVTSRKRHQSISSTKKPRENIDNGDWWNQPTGHPTSEFWTKTWMICLLLRSEIHRLFDMAVLLRATGRKRWRDRIGFKLTFPCQGKWIYYRFTFCLRKIARIVSHKDQSVNCVKHWSHSLVLIHALRRVTSSHIRSWPFFLIKHHFRHRIAY